MIRKFTILKRGFSSKPHFFDSNDTLNSLALIRPKMIENLQVGKPTFGFWEYVCFCDDLIQNSWVEISQYQGMGMGAGLISLTMLTRLAFMPLGVYSQVNMAKMKRIQPQSDEINAKIKKYYQTGEREKAQIEMKKHKELRKKNGIYQSVGFLNLLQMPIHMVNFSLINFIARSPNHPLYEAMSTQGLFWFQNLCASDPSFALPIIAALIQTLNIKSILSQGSAPPALSSIKQKLQFIPLLTIPIQATFPAAFNLYIICISSFQLMQVNVLKIPYFKNRFIGEDEPEQKPEPEKPIKNKQEIEAKKPFKKQKK